MFRISVTCNYPDDEVEAATPNDPLTIEQINSFIKKLIETEPEMTSFVLTAARS